MKAKADILIKGNVQQSDYRNLVENAAVRYKLKGIMYSLPDGSISIICEGGKNAIARYIDEIRIQEPPIWVNKIKVDFSKQTGRFKRFEVIRGRKEKLIMFFKSILKRN